MHKASLIILLTLCLSCGEALNKRRHVVWEEYSANSLLMCAPESALNALFENASDLEKKIDILIIASDAKQRASFRDLTESNSTMSPLEALRINPGVLEKQINLLRDEFFRIKKMETDSKREALLLNLKDNYQKYYQRLVRYNNVLCQKETFKKKQELDVRPYYVLENLFHNICSEDIYCLANKVGQNPNDVFAQSFQNVCNTSEGSGHCAEILASEESIVKEFGPLMDSYKQAKLNDFFKENEIGPKFNCDKSDDQNSTMRIHLYSSEITLSDNDLKILAQYWNSNPSKKVSFYFSKNKKENSIELKMTKKGVSFVEDVRPEIIYISNLILDSKEELLGTLAHELGHSLGLPDCYVEFLDQNLTSVYYQLDSFNLMCTISTVSRINKDALVSIFKNRCLN